MAKRKAEPTICDALNILIWKLPSVVRDGDINRNAEWWVAELRDKDIYLKWDPKAAEFKE
jgi:hypothetical protein